MRLVKLPLEGAYTIFYDIHQDERGSFTSIYNMGEFFSHGLNVNFTEIGLANNRKKGTIRGLHYQRKPREQGKLVRCVQGCILDVIIDLRPNSETYLQHERVWLLGSTPSMLYVPPGFAHGYQTQENDTAVEYFMTDVHCPDLCAGIRYDDPLFDIRWPLPVSSIIGRDATYPNFKP